jgi:uncharacterized membrane protein YgcG
MKKLLLVLSLVLGVILVLPSKTFAQNYDYTDYINVFNSDVTLNQDASISIKESIDYHFTFERHGIYREIPINYKVAGSFVRPTLLKLNDLSYFQKGYPNSRYDTYEREYKNGYATFKIGDVDTTITGDYTYVLDYKLTYANNYFDDHDELYINITGTGWDVPINSVVANITVPGKITNKVCYTGVTDSKETNCTMTESGENKLTIQAKSLGVYEGLTVVVAMPKGTIADTTNQQRVQSIIANLGIFLPILAIIVVIVASTRVNKNKKITVIPNYDVPKGWNPLRSGFIYKNSLPSNIITAQIINLAISKYIKIKQVSNKEYELIKTEKEAPTDPEEKILYDGLFGEKDSVSLKSLSTKFYTTVATLKASTEKRLYGEEFYSNSQKNISNKFGFLGILGIILCFFTVMFFVNNAAMSWFWGLLISFIIITIFGFSIDKRSISGNEMYYELEGLKMYINTAEKHRIEFHDNPKKYLGIFENLLPYAMIFGLEKKWAKEFEDLYVEPPTWYEGHNNGLFNAYYLTTSLNHMNHQVVAHATPSNSANGFASSHGGSGGSGFSGGSSGGGFGGGGGGSW